MTHLRSDPETIPRRRRIGMMPVENSADAVECLRMDVEALLGRRPFWVSSTPFVMSSKDGHCVNSCPQLVTCQCVPRTQYPVSLSNIFPCPLCSGDERPGNGRFEGSRSYRSRHSRFPHAEWCAQTEDSPSGIPRIEFGFFRIAPFKKHRGVGAWEFVLARTPVGQVQTI